MIEAYSLLLISVSLLLAFIFSVDVLQIDDGIPIGCVKYIFQQVAKTVSQLHEMNVCHRDIKAGNILINDRLETKVIDMGLASFFGPDDDEDQFLAYGRGAPLTIPPEVIEYRAHHGRFQDSWALGVLLYQLMYKSLPFVNNDQVIQGAFSLYKREGADQGESEHSYVSKISDCF